MDAEFCIEARHEALERHSASEIFTTVIRDSSSRHPGSRTRWTKDKPASAWTGADAGSITCSSSAYLHAFETGSELRAGLHRMDRTHNAKPPLSALGGRMEGVTPSRARTRAGAGFLPERKLTLSVSTLTHKSRYRLCDQRQSHR